MNFAVIILSRTPGNLLPCLEALRRNEPDCPVVLSYMSIRRPDGVSCMWIRMRSPGFIIRSLVASGLTAARLGASKVPVNSGLAGAWEWPLFVM